MMSLQFVKKVCNKCGNMRKFVKDTPRDKESVCGNCWDWENSPRLVMLTPAQIEKLNKLLD